MVGDSVLDAAEGLVKTIMFGPRVTLPEKVVAGRVVGATVSQVLYLLHKASSMVGARILTAVLMNFKLLVPRSMLAADMVMSPVNVAPALSTYGERAHVGIAQGKFVSRETPKNMSGK